MVGMIIGILLVLFLVWCCCKKRINRGLEHLEGMRMRRRSSGQGRYGNEGEERYNAFGRHQPVHVYQNQPQQMHQYQVPYNPQPNPYQPQPQYQQPQSYYPQQPINPYTGASQMSMNDERRAEQGLTASNPYAGTIGTSEVNKNENYGINPY